MDFGVPKLEGLWWVERNTPVFEIPRSEWRWKLLIRMPEIITKELMLSTQPVVAKKKKNKLVKKKALEKMTERKCVQIMQFMVFMFEVLPTLNSVLSIGS